MPKGSDDESTTDKGPTLSPDERNNVDDGPVLSPEELDISDDERVMELDEGRYVVSSGEPIGNQQPDPPRQVGSGTDDRPEIPDGETEPAPDPTPEPEPEPEPAKQTTPELTAQSVHDWLSDDLDGSNSRYGFDITAAFDGSVSQQRMVSNDVVTIFENLVMWYAQQIDRNTPVEEVLGILLMEANVPIRYPPNAVKRALKNTGLSPDDSIADLMRVVKEEEGFQL